MNTKQIIAGAILAASVIPFLSAHAQGGLTPPGAPAPTMKTLDQVEPRTPISVAGYEISQSGSYYLIANLNASGTKPGISIIASDVTLDLNGFTISGASAIGNGVSLSIGVQNFLIENGAIRDCSGNGIVACKTTGCKFRDLRVLNHSGTGISGGYNTVIENCLVLNNDGYGIYQDYDYHNLTVINGNVVYWNALGKGGLYFKGHNGILEGIAAQTNCYGIHVDGYNWSLRACVAAKNERSGIYVFCNNTLENCSAWRNLDGFYIHNGDHNRIEDNNVIDNDFGINVRHEGNFILRNTCSGNTTNWLVVASNVCLVVDAAITGSVISGDSGGTTPGSTDPNANFPC